MNVSVLEGVNFSGRTRHLREWVGLPATPHEAPKFGGGFYIGPDLANMFSGVAPTVNSEIELMAIDRSGAELGYSFLEEVGFSYCGDRNPYTLSGGEQVIALIASAIAARTTRLAIDCALEQLSAGTRADVLRCLAPLDGELMLADNRLDEWYFGSTLKLAGESGDCHARPRPPRIVRQPYEIELVDLCYSYVRNRPVLKNFNATFPAGEPCLLKGENGSGKSTLSKLLCGLLVPSSGEIRVDGRPVKPWKHPGKYVSYHFQDPDFQMFASSVTTQVGPSDDHAALMLWFSLTACADQHPLELPYVLKKRVALASTFARPAGVVILDEPTLGQDSYSALSADSLISTGLSGLVVSHSQRFATLPQVELPPPVR